MKSIHRNPQVEEGKHNLILQNRCGNRLTLMVHEDGSEMEFVYKPNAARRKDFQARNFSNRDNQTTLFAEFRLPDLRAAYVTAFTYDPFVTRVDWQAPSLARNELSMVNVEGANLFLLSATRPLTFLVRARGAFSVDDGLLVERFCDRGEEIVAFLAFPGFAWNRFRVLDDGACVLQITEGDVIAVGGEENPGQMRAALARVRGLSLAQLVEANEAALAPVLRKSRVVVDDRDFQRVLDLNRRIIWSGMDEGGACFGAINRIYYLIWNRDGSQTAGMAARSGWPDLLKIWAPFILGNPSMRRKPDGSTVAEWLQMLGTRWTKAEDDGIYYAFLSLFTLQQTTGADDLLHSTACDRLLDSLDHTISTRFDPNEGLFGSDVRGEADLRSSPNYGYDVVNGTMLHHAHNPHDGLPDFLRAYGLYHNVNLYNALRMAAALLRVVPGRHPAKRGADYETLACSLAGNLQARYVRPDGIFHADCERLSDGSLRWIDFTDTEYTPDYWEFAWAVSVGPFFPVPEAALQSARLVRETWPKIRPYGYCPWNTLARQLREWAAITDADFHVMLAQEVVEAGLVGVKYPMKDALTEYQGWSEGWRPLPFSAGSFQWALTSLLLQSLPRGLAVRPGRLVSSLGDFHYHSARINIHSEGEGDAVANWTLDGREISGTLQIPENHLLAGPHTIRVFRGQPPVGLRLRASDARLLEARDGRLELLVEDTADLIFEGVDGVKPKFFGAGCTELTAQVIPLPGVPLVIYRIRCEGVLTCELG